MDVHMSTHKKGGVITPSSVSSPFLLLFTQTQKKPLRPQSYKGLFQDLLKVAGLKSSVNLKSIVKKCFDLLIYYLTKIEIPGTINLLMMIWDLRP